MIYSAQMVERAPKRNNDDFEQLSGLSGRALETLECFARACDQIQDRDPGHSKPKIDSSDQKPSVSQVDSL